MKVTILLPLLLAIQQQTASTTNASAAAAVEHQDVYQEEPAKSHHYQKPRVTSLPKYAWGNSTTALAYEYDDAENEDEARRLLLQSKPRQRIHSSSSWQPEGRVHRSDSEERRNLAKTRSLPLSSSTLNNQILCGYQGWFAYPGDGAPINKWKHWFKSDNDPSVTRLHVDLYPHMSEYDEADLKESNIPMKDGSNAKFYSAVRPNIVKKHFQWMEEYGISGVFHMRFMQDLHINKNRAWKTMVLRNVRHAAEATGRVFAVSYNIAGNNLDDSVFDALKEDWKKLVEEEQITQSDRYLRHGGLPVLRIYGIGFKKVNLADTAKMAGLIDWLKNGPDEKYRVFLIGGVPSRWRERINDSREELEWKGVYESLDGIHPWHVGRWTTINGFKNNYRNVISKDATHCDTLGILYMPTMWPGFSWHNLKKTRNEVSPVNKIPRLGGRFMWAQAHQYVADATIKTVWMAQFDETDEGTAIYKVAKDESEAPAEGNWLTLDADGESLPNDWYLRLCGEAQKMLAGDISLTETIPILPSCPDGCATTSPTDEPTPSPTSSPISVPTSASKDSPSIDCVNDMTWIYVTRGGKRKNCNWISRKPWKRCTKKVDYRKASKACPAACDPACAN